MTPDSERDDASQITTDRETIRTWADAHDAAPFRHQDEERYRIASAEEGRESHDRVDWDEFFDHLHEGDHVVIYHGEDARESMEVAEREDALSRSNVAREELEDRLIQGETVTSTVTETTVVEEVIVEEATIESELVDTEITDDRVVDVELVSRECTECTLEETGAVDSTDWFDEDRYTATAGDPRSFGGAPMGTTTSDTTAAETTTTETTDTETAAGETTGAGSPSTGTSGAGSPSTGTSGATSPSTGTSTTETTGSETAAGDREGAFTDVEVEYPYVAVLAVDESWSVTREFTERYTVESRVADVDVAETDAVEDRDIDVEGLQRSIVESDIVEMNLSPDEVMAEYEIETEFDEDDTIHTHFTRSRVVEDEIVDRRRVSADVAAEEMVAFERVDTTAVATETAEGDVTEGEVTEGDAAGTTAAGTETAETTAGATAGEERAVGTGEDAVPLSDDEIGKDVVDATGETIGMVTDVADDGLTMSVDPEPGIAERIKAALDWGDADENDYTVELDQIDAVTRDDITLKGAEELDEATPAT